MKKLLKLLSSTSIILSLAKDMLSDIIERKVTDEDLKKLLFHLFRIGQEVVQILTNKEPENTREIKFLMIKEAPELIRIFKAFLNNN